MVIFMDIFNRHFYGNFYGNFLWTIKLFEFEFVDIV